VNIMSAKIPPVVTVGLSKVVILPDRMRQLRADVVNELAESIRARGLLHPIIVRERPHGYDLIAGRQRLEAVRKLGCDTIRAVVLDDLDDDGVLLAEIDENLIRADLSPAERAQHVARRKELYEAKHPETKKGAAPGAGRGKKKRSQESQNESFVRDTATKTGKGRSTVARDVTRSNKVKVLDQIVGTSLDKGNEIDALAKLPEHEQRDLAARAKSGEKVSGKMRAKSPAKPKSEAPAREDLGPIAVASSLTETQTVENEPEELGALLRAWDRASEAARQKFLVRVGLQRIGAMSSSEG
jgi:ParB-like chromosome segregation protein Spo0J